MSVSNAFQVMIYERLRARAGVAALVGARVYDNVPPNAVQPYISFGPSDYVPDDRECIRGGALTLQVDCWSEAQDGKREVNALVDAVKVALHDWDGLMAVGALVTLQVGIVRVMREPDGLSHHGIVQVTGEIEE